MKTTFDPIAHVYTIDGRPVPSVTQILDETLGNPYEGFADEWHMQRGTAVHACAAMIAQGKEFECDPRIIGRVEACRLFFAENNPEVISVERALYSQKYQFAGTLDLHCKIKGQRYLVDWKSSVNTGMTALQLAAYSMMEEGANTAKGLEVILLDDGQYKTSQALDLNKTRGEFLILRATYGIKERLGLLQKKGN